MAKISLVLLLVAVQFTVLPFLGIVGSLKHPQFRVVGETVIYKSN